MPSTHAVIIDYSFLFHVARHTALKTPPEYDFTESTVYHFKGKLHTIEKSLAKLGITGYDLVFAEDRPPLKKIELYPPYRGNRKDNTHEKKALREALKQEGYQNFCYAKGFEADDVIATLAKRASQSGVLSIVVTGDRDLWQLISPSISIFNPIKKVVVSMSDVVVAFSVNPIHIPLHKALWGDSTDCIPNACPRTQKHFIPLIRQTLNGTWEEWKMVLSTNLPSLPQKCIDVYSAGEAQIEINYKLTSLHTDCQLAWC